MPGPAARAFLAYNTWRFLLLVGCFVLGALAGLRGLLLVVAALLVSGVLSYFLLARQRLAMGEAAVAKIEQGRRRLAERTAREDAYDEQLRAQEAGVTRTGR